MTRVCFYRVGALVGEIILGGSCFYFSYLHFSGIVLLFYWFFLMLSDALS